MPKGRPTQPDTNADEIIGRVFNTTAQLEEAEAKRNAAQDARDQAIVDAFNYGFTVRALARAAGLTSGRVTQIVEETGKRAGDMPVAARASRLARQRSGALSEAIRRAAEQRPESYAAEFERQAIVSALRRIQES